MDPITVGYAASALMVVLLVTGIPVGAAMGVAGIAGMWLAVGFPFVVGQLSTLPYAVGANYAYAVLPLFVLMGVLAEMAGITEEVFRVADLWLRRVKGGLYQAVVVGSAIFAAINGSTIVNAVVFTRVALPEMLKHGYSRSLSLGCIASAGSFAAMIPPSITMVIYAIICEQSVGKLLIAGIVPGILTAVIYMIGISILMRLRPGLAPKILPQVPLAERLRAGQWLLSVIALIFIVMGGLYAGLFPPSAAGAAGAFGAFVILLLRRRRNLKANVLVRGLIDSASVSCVIFLVLIGGLIFSRMLVASGVIDSFVAGMTHIAGGPTGFVLLAALLYLILGCFIDTTSMMVVTLPFLFPVVQHFDIDPIWFGILVVKLIEISVITPPVGMNLFAVMSAADPDTKFSDLVRGVMPFIAMEMVVLTILIVFPEISLWLPEKMLGR